MSQVFLFPHSSAEFPGGEEDLRGFLSTTLVRNRGSYRVAKADRYTTPQPGDIVVFHKDRKFVGEARVKQGLRRFERPERIGGHRFQGFIMFDPDTIWVYEKAVTFDDAKRSGLKVYQLAVQKTDWATYHTVVGHR